jgi:hypothetical protein
MIQIPRLIHGNRPATPRAHRATHGNNRSDPATNSPMYLPITLRADERRDLRGFALRERKPPAAVTLLLPTQKLRERLVGGGTEPLAQRREPAGRSRRRDAATYPPGHPPQIRGTPAPSPRGPRYVWAARPDRTRLGQFARCLVGHRTRSSASVGPYSSRRRSARTISRSAGRPVRPSTQSILRLSSSRSGLGLVVAARWMSIVLVAG